MKKRYVSIIIMVLLIALIIFLVFTSNFSKVNSIGMNESESNKLSNDSNIKYSTANDADTVNCLSKVKRDVNLCQNIMIKDYQENCKEDYYFFVSILDNNPEGCENLIDDNLKSLCVSIISKDKNILSTDFCQRNNNLCENVVNSNFIFNEEICGLIMNTDRGVNSCIGAVKKDVSYCTFS